MMRTDSELVARCINGDNDAFSELITRYKRLIYSVACKFSKDNEEIDDMAQEAFIKIYRSLSRYDDQYKFSTWSVKVATNICLDHVRRKKLNQVSLEEMEGFMGCSGNTPEEHYLKKEKARVLQDAIDDLPEIYRVPIVLYHQKGMSYKEIADYLGKPMSIIKNRIFRARHALKENLLTEADMLTA
jgi:RNA polymerase sigma-70 factor (ECF subfamily)